MAKVTGIEAQKNNSERYSIYIDGKYDFSLAVNDLIATGLYRGMEADEKLLEKWRSKSKQSKLLEKAYHYLSYRRRSGMEMRRYLAKLENDEAEVGSLVALLETRGLVSDDEFAAAWLRDRQNLKPSSKRKLESELRAKGLSQDVVARAVAGITQEDESEAIKRIAVRKLRQPKFRDLQKLSQYLAQQGFEYGLVRRTLEEMSGEDDLGSVTRS